MGSVLSNGNRYAHIDAMRAFAVMIVVLSHSGLGWIVPGGSGVTIFFSISGFVITLRTLREFDRTESFSISGFYLRRVLKLAPPFVLLIVIPTLVYSAFGRIDWVRFVAQITFVYNWVFIGSSDGVLPGSGVTWSLSIEEEFYLVFALMWLGLIRLLRGRAVHILTVVACFLSIGAALLRFVLWEFGASGARIEFGTDTRIDGIALGMLAAVVYHEHLAKGQWPRIWRVLGSSVTMLLALALYVGSLVIRDETFRAVVRYSLQSIASVLVIMYGLAPGDSRVRRVFTKVVAWKPIQVIGLASYSIYLAHAPLMRCLEPWLAPEWLRVVILVVAGTAAGLIVWRLVEVPVQRYQKRRRDQKAA